MVFENTICVSAKLKRRETNQSNWKDDNNGPVLLTIAVNRNWFWSSFSGDSKFVKVCSYTKFAKFFPCYPTWIGKSLTGTNYSILFQIIREDFHFFGQTLWVQIKFLRKGKVTSIFKVQFDHSNAPVSASVPVNFKGRTRKIRYHWKVFGKWSISTK